MTTKTTTEIVSEIEGLLDVGYHLDLFDAEGITSPTTQHLKDAVERLFDAVMIMRKEPNHG